MVQPQRIRPRKSGRRAVVNEEEEGGAKPWNPEPVLAGRGERAEIRLEDALIGWKVVGVAPVRTRDQPPPEDLLAALRLDKLKARIRRDRQFPQAAQIVADHRFLWEGRDIADLVDV